MLFALQHGKRDKVLNNPRGRFMASLKDSARILVKAKMPTNEYAAFNLCFSSDFWKKYLADTSDRHHMTTGNRTAVNKIVTVVADILANHIGSRADLIRLFSRNNFKGTAVFLKAALIHDQNMVPGPTQLDPSLVSTGRMVDTYMSSAITAAFKKVPDLEEFYEDFTSDGWLGTETTNLLHEGDTQNTEPEEGPAQGVMTVTMETNPKFRVELPQSVHLETRSRKRATTEMTKPSPTRPPIRPVAPKPVTLIIFKREFRMASLDIPRTVSRPLYVQRARKFSRRICTYFMEGRCKYENTCRYSHDFAQVMDHSAEPAWIEQLPEPVCTSQPERKTLHKRINQLHKEYALKSAVDFTLDEDQPRKKVRWGNRVVINTPEGIEETSDEEEDLPDNTSSRDVEYENKYDSEENEGETREPDEETDNLNHAEKIVNYTDKNVCHFGIMSKEDARKTTTVRTVFVKSDYKRPANVFRPRVVKSRV
jgi:hypothetical protein